MKLIAREPTQTAQRVKVGMIGLAAVLLLIGLAAAIFTTANRERPVEIAGAAQVATVANIAGSGAPADANATAEPLAELGVAPSAVDSNVEAPVTAAR